MNDISQANREWQQEARQRRQTQETSRNIPSRFAGGTTDVMWIYVTGGNTLDTGQDGVKYSDTEIASLDDDYDPATDDSFQDGIGKGSLYINGVEQDDPVLFVNDPRSLVGDSLLGENDDVERDRLMVIGSISLDTPTDGPRTVYLVA